MKRAIWAVALWIEALVAAPKFFRRVVLIWAMTLTTIVVLRVTTPEVLTKATAGGATIAVSAIGILLTVVTLYQWLRQQDENK